MPDPRSFARLSFWDVLGAIGCDGGLARNLQVYGGVPDRAAVEATVYQRRILNREAIGLNTRPDHDRYLPRILEMVETLRRGGKLPPVVVREYAPDRFECFDGYHRLHAYRLEQVGFVDAFEWLPEVAARNRAELNALEDAAVEASRA